MEKVLQAQTKSCLAKSRNQDEDPCPNLPEYPSFLTDVNYFGPANILINEEKPDQWSDIHIIQATLSNLGTIAESGYHQPYQK